MSTFTAAKLLNVWENGLMQDPIERALSLLNLAYPEQPAEALAELSIGERDVRLLRVREVLFGSRMTSTTQCPLCSEQLEWESEVSDLCVNDGKPLTTELCVETETYRLKFRLPNSLDLASFPRNRNATNDARKQLLERCLLEASAPDGESLRIEQLPETALQAMAQEMERADPQSNLQISLTCPACGHCWEGLFDIVSFLWAETNHWAECTLKAVHLLARAYGWHEADILAMSPTRRQFYLEMAAR